MDLQTRSLGYQLLAAGFAYPEVDLCGLAGEYNRLFHQAVAASPYESDYLATDKGAVLGQLAALLEAFGLRAGGAEHERVDHIGTELELAGFLALKEHVCAADAEHAATTRRARQVFLEEHLGTWVPAFRSRLAAAGAHPFYQRLAELAVAWVADDLQTAGWRARPLPSFLPVVDDGPMRCPLTVEEDA